MHTYQPFNQQKYIKIFVLIIYASNFRFIESQLHADFEYISKQQNINIKTERVLEQVNNTQFPQPTKYTTTLPIMSIIAQDNKLASVQFKQINFQIYSQVYITRGHVQENNLFNKSFYLENNKKMALNFNYSFLIQADQYCNLYPSSVTILRRSIVSLSPNTQPLKHYVLKNDKKSKLYLISSNSMLQIYIFDRISLKLLAQYTIPAELNIIKQNQLISNVEMLSYNENLVLFKNNAVYILDQNNISHHFIKVQIVNQNNGQVYEDVQNIIDVGMLNDHQIWVSGNHIIDIYQINNLSNAYPKIIKKSRLSNFTNKTIVSVQYCENSQMFYVLAGNVIHIIKLTTQNNYKQGLFKLQSQCSGIKKIDKTIYAFCMHRKWNYIAQLLIIQSVPDSPSILLLNRYYDESTLQGIRDVRPIGYDKIALIGDQSITIIGQAVNRQVLLQMQNNEWLSQNQEIVYTFGMIDMYYIPEYSTVEQSTILILNQNSVELSIIVYEPPELQCVFSRSELGASATVLVVFNATSCPSAYQPNQLKLNRLSSAQTICQVLYPIQFQIGQKQYEQKAAKLILFIALLLLIVLMLVCAGCGIKVRNNYNVAIQRIKNKIKQIKKKTNTQQS